jgi:hypothetical protein
MWRPFCAGSAMVRASSSAQAASLDDRVLAAMAGIYCPFPVLLMIAVSFLLGIYLQAMRIPFLIVTLILLNSCGSPPKPAASKPAKKAELAKPLDESDRFPTANLAGTKVVDKELMGKTFMPGGTLARYKKGKKGYEMFVAKLATSTDAAILLLDWHKTMADSKLIPSFGGYFGLDAGRPVFVFSKGVWIAGIAGLPQKEADVEARALASRLN